MKQQTRFLIRVDGSKEIGLGHVYNMLTFLNNLHDEEILIVMNKNRNLGSEKFKKFGYKIKFISNNNNLKEIIDKFNPDVICNDLLNTTTKYMKNLKKFDCVLVNFEDLGEGRKLADLVFNPIYYAKNSNKNEFYGEKFACVREEFRIQKRNRIRKNVKNIVITFGGTDPTNKTQKILEILKIMELKKPELIVILGLGYSKRIEIKKMVKEMNQMKFNIKIIEKSDNLSEYFKRCDFAITSNGRTVFEIAAMKIPMIAIAVNNRERLHSFVRYSKCGFHIDMYSKQDYSIVIRKISDMLDYENREKFVKNLHDVELLNGINKVKELIYKKLS